MAFSKLAAGMAMAFALALSAPASAQEKLVVGAYPANPPWEFKTESGSFEGFEIDVATEVAKRLGRPVEFQDMGFQALFAASSSGRIDFAVSSISVNNERLQNQSFTQPYYDGDGTVIGREASDITGLDGLKGKVIGVVAGTTGEAWAKETPRNSASPKYAATTPSRTFCSTSRPSASMAVPVNSPASSMP